MVGGFSKASPEQHIKILQAQTNIDEFLTLRNHQSELENYKAMKDFFQTESAILIAVPNVNIQKDAYAFSNNSLHIC